jgi:hypothetical protein
MASFSKDIILHQRSNQIQGFYISNTSESTFQLPERVFMPDVIKDAWIADLAGSKPLEDLIKAKIPLG